MKCKCCGAPLHGNKCDYCGETYEELNPIMHYQVDTYTHPVETLACRINMPLYYMRDDNKDIIEEKIKHDMARKMSEELLNYMDVETWIDPAEMVQCFGGRIKVAKPQNY